MPRQGTRGGIRSISFSANGDIRSFSITRENENIIKSLHLSPLKSGGDDKVGILSVLYLILLQVLSSCTTMTLYVCLIALIFAQKGIPISFQFMYPGILEGLIVTVLSLTIAYVYTVTFKIGFKYALYVFLHSMIYVIPVMFVAHMLELLLLNTKMAGVFTGMISSILISYISGYLINANFSDSEGRTPETRKEAFVQNIVVIISQLIASIFFVYGLYKSP
ncbi:hypothetical protein NECID01_1056 [Nematocida sp. AWRm77]|nr:hypothetical protein NECID01_1056 [Nematocida sp. AWRm77]